MHFLVSDDPAALAAQHVSSAIRAVLDSRDVARVAISGGSALGAWIAAATTLSDVLAHVRLTWVDERCVPVTDPSSNRGEAHRRMADAGVVAPQELPLWQDGETPDQALARIRMGLTERFDDALDVTLLGMGPDGHIASLFPGRIAHGDRASFIDDSPKPPPQRVTLTRAMLATAKTNILLAMGESKREALMRLARGDVGLPATGLPALTIITDLTIEETPDE